MRGEPRRQPLIDVRDIRYTIIARWDGAYWTGVFECLSLTGAEILNAAWSHFCAENELRPEDDESAEENRQNFEPIVIFRGEIPMGRDQIYWGDTGIVEHVAASIPQVMKEVA